MDNDTISPESIVEEALNRPSHERFDYLRDELSDLTDNPKLDNYLTSAKETHAQMMDEIDLESSRDESDLRHIEANKESLHYFNITLENELQELNHSKNVTEDDFVDVLKALSAPAIVDDMEEL